MISRTKLFFYVFFTDFFRLVKSKNSFKLIGLILFYYRKTRYKEYKISFSGFNLRVIDSLSFTWQYKEIFVDECYKFHADSKKPIIYDCGANIGLSSLYFTKAYPGAIVKAFEADPKIASVLDQNIANNNANGVKIYNKAVWINNENVSFETEGADGGFVGGENNVNSTKIEALRLRDLLNAESSNIDFLKIDIEGAETAVLMDCKEHLQKVKHIFIEYHDSDKQTLGLILNILGEAGFKYYLETANRRKFPFIDDPEKEYIFRVNISAVRS